MTRRTFGIVTAALALSLATTAPAATVTIDPSRQFQTIDGFGGLVSEWNMGLHSSDALISQWVNDLGVSIMRYLCILSFEAANENADANSLDLGRFSMTGDVATQMGIITKFKNAGQAGLGVEKMFVSPLSPPAFMKTNANVVGGKLRTDMYQEWGEHLAAYCKAVKQQTGVDLYAISMENEPEWEQWYASCVITPAEMRDVIKVVGPRLAAEGVPAKVLWAETLLSSPYWGAYLGLTMQDTLGRRYAGVYAVHSYEDGVNPGSPGAATWRRIHTAAATFPQVRLWMSETSGYPNTWDGALTMAQAIYASLAFGQASAWVWHSLNSTSGGGHEQEALCIDGTPKKHYYIAKQYYRWVRPGAIAIGASWGSDTSLGCVAFGHAASRTLTLVLLNTSAVAKDITLAGQPAASARAYRTSATDNCADLGTVGASLTLPASSITTLYATEYDPVVKVQPGLQPSRIAAKPSAILSAQAQYRIDGSRTTPNACASGVYLRPADSRTLRAVVTR